MRLPSVTYQPRTPFARASNEPHAYGAHLPRPPNLPMARIKMTLWHGNGQWNGLDGDHYEGQFDQNLRQGHGKYTGEALQYEGQWLSDLRHGEGSIKWANQETYEGCWRKDKKPGAGLWKNLEGCSYEGEWQIRQCLALKLSHCSSLNSDSHYCYRTLSLQLTPL